MRCVALIAVALFSGSGCLFESTVPEDAQLACSSSADCPDGSTCPNGRCVSDAAIAGERCGDGLLAQSGSEECDDGDDNDDDRPDACRSDCVKAYCGDGVRDNDEACDDGNLSDTDACLATCVLPFCGDGAVQEGEACDDGNSLFNDGCLPSCAQNTCGDGFLFSELEECDDANAEEGDSCTNACVRNVCGDGLLNTAAEGCDDGNTDDGDDCTALCANALCGDGVVRSTSLVGEIEECDDGNGSFDDECLPNCNDNVCGDGFVKSAPSDGSDPELCDDGNTSDLDACRTSASDGALCIPNVCGDGLVDVTEEACDDGNAANDDHCRSARLIAGFDDCQPAACGDGIVDIAPGSEEACDDGNLTSLDDCLIDCRSNLCGDGVVNSALDALGDPREVCDDANSTSLDGCSGACSLVAATYELGFGISAAPTLLGEIGQHLGILLVGDDERVHLVLAGNGDVFSADLPAPAAAPVSVTAVRVGVVPTTDGALHLIGVGLLDPSDAGPGDHDAGAFISVTAPVQSKTGHPTGGAAAATAAGLTIGVDDHGGMFKWTGLPSIPDVLLAPLAGLSSCVDCAPTLVLDALLSPKAVLIARNTTMRFVGVEVVADADGGITTCGESTAIQLPGPVVGQPVVTDRGDIWASTASGHVVFGQVNLGSCPPVGENMTSIHLAQVPTGPPAVGLEPDGNLPFAYVSLANGEIARVVAGTNGLQATKTAVSDVALVGGPVLNAAREVFVSDAAGVLYGLREGDTGIEAFIRVDLGAPLSGAPLVLDRFLVATTVTGRMTLVERAGTFPPVTATWARPYGNLSNTSATRGTQGTVEGGGGGGGCSQSHAAGGPFVLALALLSARRKRTAQRTCSA